MSNEDIVYGWHAVLALFEQKRPVQRLWVQEDRHDARTESLLADARHQIASIERVSLEKLNIITAHGRHQGIAAQANAAQSRDEDDFKTFILALRSPAFLLVLDGVQDPHNLGACLRSACAVGMQAVLVPKDRAVDLTAIVRKTAAGAAEKTPIFRATNLVRTLRWLKQQNVWLVGLAGEADGSLYDLDLTGPLALVLGAEGGGLRRLTKEYCDFLVRLPMAGDAGSLNVSVAAGVAMFEALRQRGIQK